MRNMFKGLLALALTFGIATEAQAQWETLLTDVTIVDVAEGTLTPGQSVLISDGLITEVGADIASASATHLDGAGGYLIPGLWDSHVHIFSTSTEPDTALPLYLINGVTGIRDMGALWSIADQQALQARIEAGEVLGPRLILAGAWVDASPGSWPGMIPAEVREAWNRPDFRLEAMADEVLAMAQESIALDRRTFLMAHAAGVPILVSTDASFANPYLFHGFSLLDELDLYLAIGLTPREALFTATVAPPRFFGQPDQDGIIAPGRRADLVLLDANPLEGLSTLRRPQMVIAGGRVLDRAALNGLETMLLERSR